MSFIEINKINEKVKNAIKIDLQTLITNNTKCKFRDGKIWLYKMRYKDLNFSHTRTLTKNEYTVEIPMHSLSGEENDIELYTYAPEDMVKFVRENSVNKYSFLPITIWPIFAADNTRHDMLIVFDNDNKKIFLFSPDITAGLFQSKDMPSNILDLLLRNIFKFLNKSYFLNYEYENTDSWTIKSIFQMEMPGLESVISMAWCVVFMKTLIATTIEWMCLMDTCKAVDRFNYIYMCIIDVINTTSKSTNDIYTKKFGHNVYIPQTRQISSISRYDEPLENFHT